MMKRFLVALTLSTALLTSCTKEITNEDTQQDTPAMTTARTAIEATNRNLLSGEWRIGTYMTANGDIGKQYASLAMNFTSIGHVIAFRDGITTSGDWATSYIDEKIRIGIVFSNTLDLNSISDDWYVISSSTTAIKLQNVLEPREVLTLVK